MPLVVYILGLTIFSLNTSEFMVAGMMPSLTQAFGVSVTQIGYLISLYALGMVIGGPLLTAGLLKLRVSNKSALLWLLGLYAVAQSVAASTDSYAVMAAARVVTGVAASACFGASLAICAEVVDVEVRGRAASIVLGGLMLAAALGVPMATLIDQYLGWRASFWLVVALTILCAVAIGARAPRSQTSTPISLTAELAEFRNRHLWAAYATSALIIGATFAAFSYFTPILTEVAGFSAAAIPWLLGSYGVANIVGNTVVGRHADKHTFPVMVCGLSLLIAALIAFALLAHSPAVSVVMVLMIGLVGVTMNPAMVARVMRTARPGPLVNTVHTSVINIGLGMGAWLGGLGIGAGYGLRSPLWVGVVLGVLGLASLLPYLGKPRAITGGVSQR
ncbi:MFS transporter [Burkholderia stabilis]|uniref:Inner membrane transport protein ydhP,MFS transport protein AraJ,Arabinose efflux permease,multidrug resistance protein,Major Facilitator Superfamily n=1 Tax=Burkholderia stabilis TaxID=95485 RepID=A0AAJ5T375_9BURK|nr:MFS transporter [Burkholderia stabilis]VBB11099.1 Inner membrane transport protein ydhP,MFS transport protein AraJ,Arabinose efflux permease,multidrug resistance protein,Major Facilitator Superfamily [Burkholderia stabilis]